MQSLPVHTEPFYELRPYQLNTLDKARDALAQEPSVLITAPTGAGKTVMVSELVRRAALKGLHSDIVVHREELIDQFAETLLAQTGIKPGVIWQSRREWDAHIRILSHGTVIAMDRWPEGVRRPNILFLDEAHHGAAPGWRYIIELIAAQWLIGMTATPFRNDREPLVPNPFASVIRSITPQELIELGVLVPPVVVSPAVSDQYGNPQPVNQAANLPGLYLDAIRYAIGRGRSKIILFTSSSGSMAPTQVAITTAKLVEQAGIPCYAITEESSSAERRRITKAFDKLPTCALINYMTLTEGYDSKCVDCVILGRASRAESTIIQMIGRGLREYPGKTSCLILNFTGRTDINNIINYWRLDNEDRTQTEPRAPIIRVPSDQQLDNLTTKFPDMLSAIGDTQVQYPWLQPFPERRLRTLCMWNPDRTNQSDSYICVEPTTRNQWQVTQVRLPKGTGGNVHTINRSGLSSQEAAQAVHTLIGEQRYLFNRNANWRRQPATDPQRRTWQAIHETDPPDNLTRGDASDAISLLTFQKKVSPKLV